MVTGITAYKKEASMNTIVYIGMDVHKESYTLCCYCYDTDKVEYKQTIPSDYRLILKYMEQVRTRYEGEVTFVCGYEAGCLGYSLYHQLKGHEIDCKILAPSTMAITNTSHVKTDKRDAANIARRLAFHTYSEVYIPDEEDNAVKEYIRMRDDQKLMLKKSSKRYWHLSFVPASDLRVERATGQ
jgi:transposase